MRTTDSSFVNQPFGPYQVVELLGVGGMGEVYRAHDARLRRDIAIKILPRAWTEDPARLARFEREARVLASLNHPNIAAIFGIEEHGASFGGAPVRMSALILELVEGDTLADRLRHRPLAIAEALQLARQIASALDAAHEKGVVHRDLKPSNIKITPDGMVKVLDFGLALIASEAATLMDGTGDSIPTRLTMDGMLLGTAPYMSPEQARGQAVDKRTDIWAFGCVLYEMLTGRPAFARQTLSDTIVAVLEHEPAWEALPKATPPDIRRLLERLLARDLRRRFRDIGDVAADLDAEVAATPASAVAVTPLRRWLPWFVAAGAVAVAILAFARSGWMPSSGTSRFAGIRTARLQMSGPADANFTDGGVFALSPDGRHVVFAARHLRHSTTTLWVRSLDELEPRRLPDAETGVNPPLPFWSLDSRRIVFDAGGTLKAIHRTGGAAQTICALPNEAMGGSWNREGTLLLGQARGGLLRVPAAGGAVIPVTALDGSRQEQAHQFPTFLPDGQHFLYMRVSNTPRLSAIHVGSLARAPEEQPIEPLLSADVAPVFVRGEGDDAWIVFRQGSTLFAQTFDTRSLRLVGEANPVADDVAPGVASRRFGLFSASADLLVYRREHSRDRRLTWFDRSGRVLGTVGEPARDRVIALSPTGTRAAVARPDARTGNDDIWLLDLTQGTATRLTFDPADDQNPVWSPDERHIAFNSNRGGDWGTYQKATSGAGAEHLLATRTSSGLTDWTRDGRFLLYHQLGLKQQFDLWLLPLTGVKRLRLTESEFSEIGPYASPDARFVVFQSNESGRNEVYVQPLDPSAGATGQKWLISKGTLGLTRWRGDGKELFYLSAEGEVMAVSVTTDPTFSYGVPRALFRVTPAFFSETNYPGTLGAVAPDGQRFLLAMPVAAAAPQEFTAVSGWTNALRR